MSPASGLVGLELDRLIHEKSRLMILAFLSSSPEPELGFMELREALGMSAGNLSIQLRNLEEAGYVRSRKSFRGNKPYTGIGLAPQGKRALEAYLSELEVVVATLKGPAQLAGGSPAEE
jgi:DNA-binding transcriptional ArsR family regulator